MLHWKVVSESSMSEYWLLHDILTDFSCGFAAGVY